jgi:hypothetical protein
VGNPETKRPLGIPKRKWEDDSKVDFKETGREVVDWIHLAQDSNQWWAYVIMIMNFQAL